MSNLKELTAMQTELKVPKSQFNAFGNYRYRKTEDITEAVKPLLKKYDCGLLLDDDIVLIGARYYVKATATLTNKDGLSVSATGWAREEEVKKGMDASQVTGAASSYARKYALNGLFALDDSKDADAQEAKPAKAQASAAAVDPDTLKAAIAEVTGAKDAAALKAVVTKYRNTLGRNTQFVKAVKASPYCPKR